MIYLHLLGWTLGVLGLLGIILGLRKPALILFWLSPGRRTKPLALAFCVCLGLLGAFLAISGLPQTEMPETAMPDTSAPSSQEDASTLAGDPNMATPKPASPAKSPLAQTGVRASKPPIAKPTSTTRTKTEPTPPPLTPAQERAQEAIISQNRCLTASGYMMAQSYELLVQAEGLLQAGNKTALKDLESRGSARRLPPGVEVPLWDQDLAHGLVKFLIPGEEILYWTRLQAVECNL
ncbi:hypothetical protein [Desulfocurvibacter africanus]|uniref:Uncharacterized protein n=1 Tax=Desulfocurvibacter africanus subsp. africanus str. Walvis Bay TaxID=690850 RepID=F3YYP2_DESAF|nr:hypothetical protein [Desulfocurvibacter africanus]EGJ51868.1 hypothetical protein Desaf_3589 [Desulfocurvibacter africanus subsp. africanus str. Walvis Bay]